MLDWLQKLFEKVQQRQCIAPIRENPHLHENVDASVRVDGENDDDEGDGVESDDINAGGGEDYIFDDFLDEDFAMVQS